MLQSCYFISPTVRRTSSARHGPCSQPPLPAWSAPRFKCR
jgi:hypothetical protein